ncbi:MAG: hypothetical protein ABJC04_07695 [Verrucomicrobiota bacterium]
MGKTRQRKTIFISVALLAVFFILLAALPVWFPWVLQPILQKQGITFSRYERDGYTRFILREVKFARPALDVAAARAEIILPTTLLWRRVTGSRPNEDVAISDWKAVLHAEVKKKTTNSFSLFQKIKKIDPALAKTQRWLAWATLTNGVIVSGAHAISVPSLLWDRGKFSGEASAPKLFPETFFKGDLSAGSSKKISLKIAAWNLQADWKILEKNRGLQMLGAGFWQSNRFDLTADFNRENAFPVRASVIAKDFQIPGHNLRLEGYGELTGSATLLWETNHFTVDVSAHAEPLRDKDIFLSPVDVTIRASGDTNLIRVAKARIVSPWLQVTLSENTEFNFRGEMLSPGATLQVEADLSRQKWLAAGGKLSGVAELRRGKNKYPDVNFSLAGSDLVVEKMESDTIKVEGGLEWPWLQIRSAKIHFKDGATGETDFRFNAVQRTVANGHVRLDGAIGQKFLPPGISCTNVSLTAHFSGLVKKMSHSGKLSLTDLKFPKFSPLSVSAKWRGEALEFTSLHAKITAGNSSLEISGAGGIVAD